MEDNYYRYKCLLEYFVTHLEYVQTKSANIAGYKKYIEPILNGFIVTGLGYNDQTIQKQISKWSNYGGHQLCINVTCSFGSYMTNQCYLNWRGTWLNTRPIWNKAKQTITGLYLSKQETASAKSELSFSLSELGLFDEMVPNENLKKFFDTFETFIVDKEKHEVMIEYADLLKSNKNLILTGAPGTGKTYLAKQIAKELGATEENHQCKMVQFHPSYDYTDFVEGLRPIQKDGESNIGFELKRGVFKDFCAQALENLIDSRKSRQDINEDVMFKRAYDDMMDKIQNEEIKEIPLKSNSMSMEIVDVSDKNNLILRAKGSDSGKTYTVSFNRLRKLSLVYKNIEALDSIQNIYKAVTDAIKGCNASAYWATLYFMYKNFMHHHVIEGTVVERKNFVFIIDEINRGEVSKIFGELFFSIDPGYRGEIGKIQTQYQNLIEDGDVYEDGFYVPENVYIIGTMNDIDRSVESFDFAMRRRFVWQEIPAEESAESMGLPQECRDRMKAINNIISEIEGLGPSYHIGGAYFLDENGVPINDFGRIWNLRLEPLLREYLRGMPNADDNLNKLREAYGVAADNR